MPKRHCRQAGGEAVACAREAVRLAPYDPNGHLALAQALPLIGEIHEADRAVQESLRIAPNSAATWTTASFVVLGAKNGSAAAAASRRALELDPENYSALNNLGVALRAGGHGRKGTRVLADAARASPDVHLARQNLTRAGLNIARVVIMILLLPLGFITHSGVFLYIVFAIGSNIFISRRPDLVLRLERWGVPIALFFAGKSDVAVGPAEGRQRSRNKRSAARDSQPWSATAGHSVYALGTPVVIFCAVAAWSVALILLIGLVVPGSDKLALALVFPVFAGLGAFPVWVVLRRRRRDGNRTRDSAADRR